MRAAETLPGSPRLALTTAPRGGVEVAELPPLPGFRQGGGRAVTAAAALGPEATPLAAAPMRLAETLKQTEPRPGRLMIRLDIFDQYHYAAVQQAKVAGLGAVIVSVPQGRGQQYRVQIGPLPDVARADAVLDQALLSGIPDARIIID